MPKYVQIKKRCLHLGALLIYIPKFNYNRKDNNILLHNFNTLFYNNFLEAEFYYPTKIYFKLSNSYGCISISLNVGNYFDNKQIIDA